MAAFECSTCDNYKCTCKKETVNHPSHYNTGKYEVIDVIEDWNLGFNDGNAIKYIARHKHKGKPLEDLKKARWYIERLIQQFETTPDTVTDERVFITENEARKATTNWETIFFDNNIHMWRIGSNA